MNRLDRLSAILILLQSKKRATAKELADRFSVSERTIYRDIDSLSQSGAPIGAAPGIGYFIDSNFQLPPITLNSEEAFSILIAEKLIESFPDRDLQNQFKNAIDKIKASLHPMQRERIEALYERIQIYSSVNNKISKKYDFALDLQEALFRNETVKIVYSAKYNNTTNERIIEPIGLCNYMQEWHLIAYCKLRNDYRDFRVDRIIKLERLESKPHNRRLSLDEYFKTKFEKLDLIEIRIKFEKNTYNRIENSKFWYGFSSHIEKDEYFEAVFFNSDLDGFARWTLGLGKGVKILEPLELSTIRTELIKELADGNS